MSKQYLSVPVQYNTSETLQSDDIKIPVEILVMHDQVNLNQSNFDFAVIDADITKESLKNIPILGYIKKVDGSDSKDFAGHEMEVVFKDGEFNITYLERPIGVIPESNNYEYIEKDGKKYVKVIGYLWKDYINDGYSILQESPQKSVSMEIVVDAYEVRKDGIVDIKAYRYTGVTVLGDNVLPGMQGANMQVIGQFSNDQKFSTEFYERVEKLNFELKNNTPLEGGENKQMSKEKDGENMDNVDNVVLSFSATYRQKREALCNALDPIIVKDDEDKIVEETYFYVEDFDDTHVMVEKYFWSDNNRECTCGRFTYSFDADSMSATVDMGSWELMMMIWVTEAEHTKIEEDRKSMETAINTMSAEFEELKIKTAEFELAIANHESSTLTLTEQFNIVTEENKTLLEYKNNTESEIKKSQVDDIISDFESVLGENEEFKVIKVNAMSYEIEALEEKLYSLEGKVKHAKVNKPAKKPQTFSRVSVDPEVNNDVTESYYGDAVKFIPKN